MHVPKQKLRKPTAKQMAARKLLLAELGKGKRPLTQADLDEIRREWAEAENR